MPVYSVLNKAKNKLILYETVMNRDDLKKLFYPKSLMVVGVSGRPDNLGKNIVENIDRFHYEGDVFLVGKGGGNFGKRIIYEDISDIGEVPDLAVFLIPGQNIPKALEECGQKGVPFSAVESGGFSEFYRGKSKLEQQILSVLQRWKMRLMGPNCLSIINTENSLVLPFVPLDPGNIKTGSISIVCQSGGIAINLLQLCSLENLGVNKVISMGNKLDLNENDYLKFLLSDSGTKTIGIYLESISDGRRLMDLAGSTKKPIVALKSNTNRESNQIASFHTSALAGDDKVADSALRQAGIHRVNTLNGMIDAFRVFSLPLMKGPNLAVLSRSGGGAVMAADAVAKYNFRLVKFSEDFFSFIRNMGRAGVIRMTNPLDLGDIWDITFYRKVLERTLKETEVHGVLLVHGSLLDVDGIATVDLVKHAEELSEKYQKPVATLILADSDEWSSLKKGIEFPIFREPEDALKALSFSMSHYRNTLETDSFVHKRHEIRLKGKETGGENKGILSPEKTFELLMEYGVSVPDYEIVYDYESAAVAADHIGYPVALKVGDEGVVHKTDSGGVRLGISNSGELSEAFRLISAKKYIVQKMTCKGHETFIGGRRDSEFGPVILFGLGGIFVEVFNDVSIRVTPITEEEAGMMIGETKGSALFKGFRGEAAADTEPLKRQLVNVSRLLNEHSEINTLDINPLIVFKKGQGCLAVDAKVFI